MLLISMLDDKIETNFIVEFEYKISLKIPIVSKDKVMNDPMFDVVIFVISQLLKFKLEDTIEKTVSSEVISLTELLMIIMLDK